MKVGDLVVANTGTKHHGIVGLVIDKDLAISDCHSESLLTVLYPTGERVVWGCRHLEVISESR